MTKEEAFKKELTKYPLCVITGEKVKQEQAFEIIRRTDNFFQSSLSDGEKNEKYARICKMPIYEEFQSDNLYYKASDEFEEKWGVIPLEYLYSFWIDQWWYSQRHGWCHPDGTISYCLPIGKYPTVKEIYDELSSIAEAFEFLNMTCTLVNDSEWFNNSDNYNIDNDWYDTSVVTMKVQNGKVDFINTIPCEELHCRDFLDEHNDSAYEFKGDFFTEEDIQRMADIVWNK